MSDIVIEETAETSIYLGEGGHIVISQSNPLGDDPECVLIWPKDINRLIKRLKALRKESLCSDGPVGLIGLKGDEE